MSVDPTWAERAEEWARFARSPEHDHFFWTFNGPRFLELVPEPRRCTVDVACGEGRLGRLLAERGHRVVAVDAARPMARLAARAGEQSVVVADAGRLPLAGGVADAVTAFMCLQDIPDLGAAIAEIARVLAPGGRFCAAIAHPLRSAGHFASKRADAQFRVDSYFDETPWTWRTQHTGMSLELPGVHRPLEAYTRALESAGLAIETLREPRPGPEHVAGYPEIARWRRLPCVLHLRAARV